MSSCVLYLNYCFMIFLQRYILKWSTGYLLGQAICRHNFFFFLTNLRQLYVKSKKGSLSQHTFKRRKLYRDGLYSRILWYVSIFWSPPKPAIVTLMECDYNFPSDYHNWQPRNPLHQAPFIFWQISLLLKMICDS